MHYFRSNKSFIAWVSVLLMFFTQIAPLQAAMVGNDTLMTEITRAELIASLDKTEVQNLLVSSRLAAHEYPRQVRFIDTMPMTTTGKIIRGSLRKMAQDELS